jgi:exonuclease V gamma subunit
MSSLGVDRFALRRVWQLAQEAAVTFGASARQRDEFAIYPPGDDLGTWEHFVDRVVSSSAFGPGDDDATLGVPDDLASMSTLQPLLRLLDANHDVRHRHGDLSGWLDDLEIWTRAVVPASATDDSVERALARARRWIAAGETPGPSLSFAEFRSLWRDGAVTRTRQRTFGARGVTVTSASAMPFAPYRLVCILGLDESALPSSSFSSTVLGERRVGDPDPRRSLTAALLAAIATARETLVVTWNERSESSGHAAETAIPLEELIATISTATTTARGDLVEVASRHGFAVNAENPRSITFTYDARLGDCPLSTDPRRLPAQAVRDQWRVGEPTSGTTCEFNAVRRFLSAPVARFVRDALGADLPEQSGDEVEVPPVALGALQRSRLQRDYVTELAGRLQSQLTSIETVREPPIEVHVASEQCEGQPCWWLHGPALEVRAEVLARPGAHQNVPERLWRNRMQYPTLDLAAYNLATDNTDYEDVSPELLASLRSELVLGNQTLQLGGAESFARTVAPRRSLVDDAIAAVRFECRNEYDERHLLVDLVDLAVMAASWPGETVEIHRSFMPKQATTYKRRTGTVPVGRHPLNPRTVIRFTGTHEDALAVLGEAVNLWRRGTQQPLALFRRQSPAVAATGLFSATRRDGSAATAPDRWSASAYGFGESTAPEHRLLFPLERAELDRLEPTGFPLLTELRSMMSHYVISIATQTQRRPALIRTLSPDASDWNEIPNLDGQLAEFRALVRPS